MSSYTRAIISPQLPGSFTKLVREGKLSFSTILTRNEGTSDESKNVSDAIRRSNSFCNKKILFLTDHNVSYLRLPIFTKA